MKKNYEILEISGYSGEYALQQNGTMKYTGKVDGNSTDGKYKAEYYLDSPRDKLHYIKSVRIDIESPIFTIGDETPVGVINEFMINNSTGEMWVGFYGDNRPNMRLLDICIEKSNLLLLI